MPTALMLLAALAGPSPARATGGAATASPEVPARTGAVPPPDATPEEEAASEDEGQRPEPVLFTRWFPGGRVERVRLRLLDEDGAPDPEALVRLSILARPSRVPHPAEEDLVREEDPDDDDAEVAPGIRRLHPGLLPRLQAIADRFPGHRIVVVSGHRPNARPGSRHRHGRALDIKVGETPREDVVAAARALPKTGVGYYPNSVFTHVDVRHREAYWVDRSRPGEPADYGPWPDPSWTGHRHRDGATDGVEEPDPILASILAQVRAGFEMVDDEPPLDDPIRDVTPTPERRARPSPGEGPPPAAPIPAVAGPPMATRPAEDVAMRPASLATGPAPPEPTASCDDGPGLILYAEDAPPCPPAGSAVRARSP